MSQEEKIFHEISENLSGKNELVHAGRMMSSPGITYKNKVFAFYYNREMVFRLGKGFQPESIGISEFNLLNPFKYKAPLAGWFVISGKFLNQWKELANRALKEIQRETSEK